MSRQGDKTNEDYAFACESFLFVVDGSSGLSDKNFTDYESDARWLAQRTGNQLRLRLGDTDKGLREIITKITEELAAEFRVLVGKRQCNALDMPSACLSAFRLNRNTVEYFQLGDCVAVIVDKNGKTMILHDPSVPVLDDAVVEHLQEVGREKKISVLEALPYGKEMLVTNRSKMNIPGGYWILDLSGVGIEHAFTRNFKFSSVQSLAVMTDGFADIMSLFKLHDAHSLMERLENGGMNDLFGELFTAQDEDPFLDRYPRLKFRDDSSVAWCKA